MQRFMIRKGLLDQELSDSEFESFIEQNEVEEEFPTPKTTQERKQREAKEQGRRNMKVRCLDKN